MNLKKMLARWFGISHRIEAERERIIEEFRKLGYVAAADAVAYGTRAAQK